MAAVAAALALTGCGSSGGSNNTASSGPSGSPIKVMYIDGLPSAGNPDQPEIQAAIQAHLDAVNASGGINGRKVELVVCHDEGDPNVSRTCANQAVTDKSIIATVGDFSQNDAVIDPIMEQANIAQVGLVPQANDLKCSVCFSFVGGGTVDTVAIGALLSKYDGVKKIAMAIPQVPVAQAEMASAKQAFLALDPSGSVKLIFIPLNAVDMSPYVQQTDGYDGTALFTAGTTAVQWIHSAASQGIGTKFGVLGVVLSPQVLSQGGTAMNGALAAADTQPPNSNVQGAVQYRSELNKYAHGAAIDQFGLEGWMAAKLFTDIARTVSGPLTRTSLLSAMRHIKNYTGFGGLIPPFSTTTPFTGLGGQAPNLYNQYVVPVKIEGGQENTLGNTFLNVFTGQTAS